MQDAIIPVFIAEKGVLFYIINPVFVGKWKSSRSQIQFRSEVVPAVQPIQQYRLSDIPSSQCGRASQQAERLILLQQWRLDFENVSHSCRCRHLHLPMISLE